MKGFDMIQHPQRKAGPYWNAQALGLWVACNTTPLNQPDRIGLVTDFERVRHQATRTAQRVLGQWQGPQTRQDAVGAAVLTMALTLTQMGVARPLT